MDWSVGGMCSAKPAAVALSRVKVSSFLRPSAPTDAPILQMYEKIQMGRADTLADSISSGVSGSCSHGRRSEECLVGFGV